MSTSMMFGRRALSPPLRSVMRYASASTRSSHQFTMAKARPNVRKHLAITTFATRRAYDPRKPPGSFFANARTLVYHYPLSMALATAAILLGIGGMVYANYFYQTYIIGAFHKYPEEVAKPLRRALYYSNVDLQPQQALDYYKQALLIADELRMDPWSEEIQGVKIQLSAFLEKLQQIPMAIEVLERTRNDNLAWLEQYGGAEKNKLRRTYVLTKTIQMSIKLAGLYAHPNVWDRDIAEERLVWAVETALKETKRRQANNVNDEDEGVWMTDEEAGAACESLAHHYEAQDQHYLSTPLFLQALALYPSRDCHLVILMNNLASSIVQQSPRAAAAAQAYAASQTISERPTSSLPSREAVLQDAKAWAQKALDVAASIQSPIRNEECDIGCAVALHNLGEIAEMSFDTAGAKKNYQEAVSLARKIGFQDGIENSSARLRGIK